MRSDVKIGSPGIHGSRLRLFDLIQFGEPQPALPGEPTP
jgi:hypothetical protein